MAYSLSKQFSTSCLCLFFVIRCFHGAGETTLFRCVDMRNTLTFMSLLCYIMFSLCDENDTFSMCHTLTFVSLLRCNVYVESEKRHFFDPGTAVGRLAPKNVLYSNLELSRAFEWLFASLLLPVPILCMCVCMCVCRSVCMYICMYADLGLLRAFELLFASLLPTVPILCMYCIYVCVYACMFT